MSCETFLQLARLLEPWQEKYPEVEAGVEVIHARPAQALAEITASADLLVLGRHAGRRPASMGPTLGQATLAVLDHAHGPIAIVPDSQAGR